MTNNPSTTTKTITLRLSHHLLAAIDDAAQRAGKNRNGYILGQLPEYYNTQWYDAKARGTEPRGFQSAPPD
jgi:hypothetical protein